MPTHEEIALDIDELTKLQQTAERSRVKDILTKAVKKLQDELALAKSAAAAAVASSEDVEIKPTSSSDSTEASGVAQNVIVKQAVAATKYYKDITTYAWDQSDKFMKLYVTVTGVHKLPKENVTLEFKNRSFRLRVENLNGANYQCHVAFLYDDTVPADCFHKVKTDTVLVMLKKSHEKKTWAFVTEQEDKKKKSPKLDEKKDPNESVMDLLKQMYDDGDDEMKRTIAKSFLESKNKTQPDDLDL